MPTYEYLCKACSHRFEAWQKMIDEPLSTCPECGGAVRRILFPAGVVFKGHGFYKTDHSNGGSEDNKKSEGDKKTESTSSETSSSESSAGTATSTSANDTKSTTATTSESKSSTPASNTTK